MKSMVLAAGAAVAACALALAAPFAAPAQPHSDGEALFNGRCKSCHEPAIDRAPNRTALAAMKPAQIVQVLTDGVMKPMAAGLSDADKTAIAAYLTQSPDAHGGGRGLLAAGPVGTDPKCAVNPPIRATASDWTQAGFDTSSTRYQPNPGLKASDVPRLKVKWTFAMSGGGMPVVIGDWLFTTNRTGKFYALDAKTGCVRWALDGVASRTTPQVIKAAWSPSGWATFIGQRDRTVHAFDAQSGKELWASAPLDPNPVAGVTGAPVAAGDRLFVPLTSGEEAVARRPDYPCCSFRGALVALDLATGKLLWKTSVIPEPLAPTHKNAAGTMMQGPAGGAIWASPTPDPKRGLVYVATGDSYTDAPTKGADAIVAIEMKTGRIRWSNQVTEHDNYIMGCEGPVKPANCPAPLGPDHDFGASPILMKLMGGKQVLLSGQKAGMVYAMDPDTGEGLWRTRVGGGGPLGGVEWGMASDTKRLFVANADTAALFAEASPEAPDAAKGQPAAQPGLNAVDPATGKILWRTPAPRAPCHYAGDRSRDYAKGACIRAQSAAPSAMPGVVFSGTVDGWFRAYDAQTGKIIWQHSTTAQTYDTVNGVKGQPGGNIDGMGAAIAGGMVYTMSGFLGAANTGGNGVNVLIAYAVDGR